MGPLAFALALHPIVKRIAEEVPTLELNAWYLDDGTLCDCKEDLLKALSIIEEDGPLRGLFLNRSKLLVYISSDVAPLDNTLPSDIPIARDGFVLLGARIGSPVFCLSHVTSRVEEIRRIYRLYHIWRITGRSTYFCVCVCLFPKFVFVVCACPSSIIKEAIKILHETLHDAVSEIVGTQLSVWSWLKATLPVSLGGLGIRSPSHMPMQHFSVLFHNPPLSCQCC